MDISKKYKRGPFGSACGRIPKGNVSPPTAPLKPLVSISAGSIFVPTFERNGMFMLGVVFLFSQLSAIEIIVLTKHLCPVKEIDSLKSNFKRYLSPILICKILDLKINNLVYSVVFRGGGGGGYKKSQIKEKIFVLFYIFLIITAP